MAVLGKIRSKGGVLGTVIGIALFAFVAEEFFRSCESTSNDQRQQIGEVLGKKISVMEFQALFDEYQEVVKMQQGQDNLSEEQLNQVKDMVWNTYVQTQIVNEETKKLGLTVTDTELQNVLEQGANPMLAQTPFVNQETGRFDANQLKRFLADYKAQQTANPQLAQQYQAVYRYWTFLEKTLRQQLLAQKYQSLLAQCFFSNKVEAEASFKASNEEATIELAAFPYSSIEDSKITVEQADIKAKYEELKEQFRQITETRNVKYVDLLVSASVADRAELQKQFAEYATKLAESTTPEDVVRSSTSLVAYAGVPVAKTAFAYDIASMIDSLAVGQTSRVFETTTDNTLNVVKLVAKQNLPDSVEYRQIQVGGETVEAARTTADSIFNALKAGADFEVIAKNYGQTGAKAWITTAQYQGATTFDADTKNYINSLNTMAAGELKNIAMPTGNIILQVVNKRAFIDKYLVAVVKKNIEFSRATYSAAYNKFSSFVSANQSLDAIEKNAQKEGYAVRQYTDLSTSAHSLAGIRGTREALKWAFEAHEQEVSPMYECGDNNHLLVVALEKVNKEGYRSLDDAQVQEYVKAEVLKDKKAAQLIEKASTAKTIADAQKNGATTTTVAQITFSSPVFVASTGASEPALAGAVASTAQGKFSAKPVKGNAGVYVYQVSEKKATQAQFDAKATQDLLRQRAMQAAGNFMNELYINAKVVDNRYLFF